MNYFTIMHNIRGAVNHIAGAMNIILPNAPAFAVEIPREASHGDYSTNVAMVYAKLLSTNPRQLAERVREQLLQNPYYMAVDIAGPGFINLTMAPQFWVDCLVHIQQNGQYGHLQTGYGIKTLVEFVSANPTGPLHVGHARGAVFGSALANLLQYAGYDVTTEYYINDAGKQIDALADSVFYRYGQILGRDMGQLPDHCYPGEYISDCAQKLHEKFGDAFINQTRDEWLRPVSLFAIDAMMDLVKADCHLLHIHHDSFISERLLVEQNKVQEAVAQLQAQDDVYHGRLDPPKGMKPDDWEEREQLLFKSTKYGDDIDRPLQKSDGAWTYFANDIANHYDKYQRGFVNLINIFGADHAGYLQRMKSATTAISNGNAQLDIITMQIVRFMKNGEPLKMSKRAGNFVLLSDLINDIGPDALRIYMLSRKPDSQMDFDYADVLAESKENPVYYLHYANARGVSVEKLAKQAFPQFECDFSPHIMGLLTHPSEIALIKNLVYFPRIIEQAAIAHEPHRIVFAMIESASLFHALWTKGKEEPALRFIKEDNYNLTQARIGLVILFRKILSIGAGIIGVTLKDTL